MSSPRVRIFIAGATGNTGAPCVRALSASGTVDVVAMTRSASAPAARELAALPNVTVVEAAYTDPPSLARALSGCQRAYIACHNGTSHFQDETAFYTAAKQAGVKYCVKLATHQPYVRAHNNMRRDDATITTQLNPQLMSYTSPIFYGRTHLALEDWLEKLDLPFTSLRANCFNNLPFLLADAVRRGEFPAINKGKAVAYVSPVDVGEIAAALLLLPDPSAHYSKRYVISGPEDCTDAAIQSLIEESRGPSAPKLRSVETDFGDIVVPIMRAGGWSESELSSVRHGWPDFVHTGLSDLAHCPTDPAILALKAPKRTMREALLAPEAQKAFAHSEGELNASSAASSASLVASGPSASASAPSPSFHDVVRARHSVRSFLSTPVPEATLRAVLAEAQLAPSNCNTQPCQVHIVSGAMRDAVSAALLAAEAAGDRTPDFSFSLDDYHGVYKARSKAQGQAYYEAIGVSRDAFDERRTASQRNLTFFNAPHVAFLFMPVMGDCVRVGGDVGMYGQTFLLSLAAHGLGGVPQTMLGFYADTVRKILGVDPSLKLLFGISFGFADQQHAANKYRINKAQIDETVTFHA